MSSPRENTPVPPQPRSSVDSTSSEPSGISHTADNMPPPPQSHQDSYGDSDSAYADSLIGDDTKTLSTYITDYRYEYGRRYHAYRDGAYWVRMIVFDSAKSTLTIKSSQL